MKDKLILFVLFSLSCTSVFARGFEPLGSKMYILENDELYVWDTVKKKTVKNFRVAQDTHCVNSLVRTELSNLSFNSFNHDTIAKSISKMHCMGLVVYKNEVMVTVRYIIAKLNLNYRYALLKFNPQLILLNQYIVVKNEDNCQYFGFISYSSPEFKSGNEFFYPNYRNTNIYLDGFALDDKSHKIELTSLGQEAIQHSNINLFVSRDQLLNPIVNTVGNAHYNWVYEYPYPVVYDRNGKATDPFGLVKLKDSLSSNETMFVVNLRSFDPYIFKERTKNVVICSQQRGQYLMMMCTDSIENSAILMRIDLETGKVIKQKVEIEIGENQFKFIGDRLYMVKREGKSFHVTYKFLEELMNP
ncbi:MAG TPA: hypothetical protein VGF79_11200 [Bacteroidia bacterium]